MLFQGLKYRFEMSTLIFNPFLTKKYKKRVACIDFQIRIRFGHGPVTCTRNLTFSPTRAPSQQNIIFPHSTLPLLTTPSSKSDLLTQSLCVTVHIHVQRLNLHREQFGCSITTLLALRLNGDGQVPPNSKSVMRAHVNNSMLPLRMRQYPGDDGVQLRHNHNVTRPEGQHN